MPALETLLFLCDRPNKKREPESPRLVLYVTGQDWIATHHCNLERLWTACFVLRVLLYLTYGLDLSPGFFW